MKTRRFNRKPIILLFAIVVFFCGVQNLSFGELELTASSAVPLTEETLDGSVVTLTLRGGTFSDHRADITSYVSVYDTSARFGFSNPTVGDVERLSDTQVRVGLEFSGNFNRDGTLTFKVHPEIIKDYGDSLDAEIPFTAVTESLAVTTLAPLTEATLHNSSIRLTLRGRTFWDDIGRYVSVSGISGVTVGDVGLLSDAQITVPLQFNGNFNRDETLTFTITSEGIQNYKGSDLTDEISVTATTESIIAIPPAPLTEATLHNSTVTLTLRGRTFEDNVGRSSVSVSGISGVTAGNIQRLNDTQITVPLQFNGNFNRDETLTFTVTSEGIQNYKGSDLTTELSVSVGAAESLTATSTPISLTEATLHNSTVRLTIWGRTFENNIERNLSVTGSWDVSVGSIQRVSDTQVTVRLDFNGNFDSDRTLTFRVTGDGIKNYTGSDFTADLPVTATVESLTATSTPISLTEATLDNSTVTLTLRGRTFENDIRSYVSVSGISGVNVGNVRPLSDTEVEVPLQFSGSFDSDKTLTFTVRSGGIKNYTGSDLTTIQHVSAVAETQTPVVPVVTTPDRTPPPSIAVAPQSIDASVDVLIYTGSVWWITRSAARVEAEKTKSLLQSAGITTEITDHEDAVRQWMLQTASDGSVDVLILYGLIPTTIYPPENAMPDGSVAESWIETTDGNTILNHADYLGHWSTGNTNIDGQVGDFNGGGTVQNLMDIPDISFDINTNDTPMFVTVEGRTVTPSLVNFQSDRALPLDQLQGEWFAEKIFANNTGNAKATLADPVIVRDGNRGRIAIVHQTTFEDNPKGEVAAEIIINYLLSKNAAPAAKTVQIHVDAADRPPMYWVDTAAGTLHRLVDADVENLVPSVRNATSLTLDVANDKLYWTEKTSKTRGKIRSVNLDGTNVQLVKDLTSVPLDITLDATKGRLYLTNSWGKVQRMNLDGSGFESNFITGLDTLTGLAIDVAGGKLYWTEKTSASTGRIRSANLDGTNVELLRDLTSVPLDIALDAADGKLYITNSEGKVQRMNLDGSGFESNFITGLNTRMHIAADTAGQRLYLTSPDGKISRRDLNGGDSEEVVTGLGNPGVLVLGDASPGDQMAGTTPQTTPPATLDRAEDVNQDGKVNNVDVDIVGAALFGGNPPAILGRLDVNGDGELTIDDLTQVSNNLDEEEAAAAPALRIQLNALARDKIQAAIDVLLATNDGSLGVRRTLAYLQNLLAMARPDETQLFTNYPNPFNPETWLPYQLSTDSDVRITIYNVRGKVIRRLVLGHQSAGYYTSRSRAAYWDGRNAVGEPVASGLYFYTFTAGDFTATRRMLILK